MTSETVGCTLLLLSILSISEQMNTGRSLPTISGLSLAAWQENVPAHRKMPVVPKDMLASLRHGIIPGILSTSGCTSGQGSIMTRSSFLFNRRIRRWPIWNEQSFHSSAEEISWRRDTQQRSAVSQALAGAWTRTLWRRSCSLFLWHLVWHISGVHIECIDVNVE